MTGEPFYSEEFPRGSFTTLMKVDAAGAKSARFTTTYTPPQSGNHYLSFSGLGPSKLFIDGNLVGHQKKEIKDSMGFLLGVQDEVRLQFECDSSRSYQIVLETIPSPVSNSELFLLDGQNAAHIGFISHPEMEQDILTEAVTLAQEADVAICFVGNTTQWETEGQDLSSMTLPSNGSQDALVAAVAKANPNTIVVNTTGVPVEVPWLGDVAALVQAWYAGQESGNAILDVLLGEVNPSGKLPISWPVKYEHTACYGNFGLDSYDSRRVEYVEGIFVGYRHFDRTYGSAKQVLFPFGYGLSYTDFQVRAESISGTLDDAGKVTVSILVTNVGSLAGAETIQVYVSPPATTVQRPPKSLVAFGKVLLDPGESRTISLDFGRDGVAYWDDRAVEEGGHVWRLGTGSHKVLIATSSRPDDVHGTFAFDIQEGISFAP
jgi:beta-glucosidase